MSTHLKFSDGTRNMNVFFLVDHKYLKSFLKILYISLNNLQNKESNIAKHHIGIDYR